MTTVPVAALLAAALVACSSDGGAGAPGPTTTRNAAATTAVAPPTKSSPAATSGPTPAPGPTTVRATAAAERTLPPGSALPGDADCAARVVAAPEIRPGNVAHNQRRGRQKGLPGAYYGRVTGDFTGTTDEILQWTACKWGIDADVVRAQAAKESYWTMDRLGDFAKDSKVCLPRHGLGVDGKPGECPESTGMLQVRYQYAGLPAGLDTWPDVAESTAYHTDFTYAYWRSCYDGTLDWLNTTDRVGTYAAGDLWGCVGIWFAGRWHTDPAEQYIAAVKGYVATRIWTTRSFIDYR